MEILGYLNNNNSTSNKYLLMDMGEENILKAQ